MNILEIIEAKKRAVIKAKKHAAAKKKKAAAEAKKEAAEARKRKQEHTQTRPTKNVDDFFTINDYHQYISGLYVTGITKNKPFAKELLTGSEQSWLPIITSGRTPTDFPLKEAISLNRTSQDQIFFSDRDRWSGDAAPAE